MQGSRIPADKSSLFNTWDVPEVKDGQIVQVEKLRQRGPKGQLVNIDKHEVIYRSLTAGQLEEISNQAYEDVRAQAYQDGLKQGRADGYQAGMQAGLEAVQKQAKSLRLTMDTLLQGICGQEDEIEQALVNLAVCVASAVLRRELTIDSQQIRQVVSEAIAVLPLGASNITIHLSEQDFKLMHTHSDIPESLQLQIDRTLTPGGCRVQTRHSAVDYTLEEQFQQTVNALVEKRFADLAAQARDRLNQPLPVDTVSLQPPQSDS
jgi:flagellar assembly protein FliH